MKTLTFTFDADLNGWLSEELELDGAVVVRIDLAELAPVVTQKLVDGEWESYAQVPEESDRYRITIRPTNAMTVRLATPVNVKDCEVYFKT